jgi:hypothetical protein
MAIKSQYQVAIVDETDISKTGVTFAASATQSSVINCGPAQLASMFLPSNWTSCNVSFLVCKTPDGTFVPLTYFDGDAYVVATTASKCIPMIPSLFHSQLYVKLSCSAPQVSACTVDFGMVPFYQGLHA